MTWLQVILKITVITKPQNTSEMQVLQGLQKGLMILFWKHQSLKYRVGTTNFSYLRPCITECQMCFQLGILPKKAESFQRAPNHSFRGESHVLPLPTNIIPISTPSPTSLHSASKICHLSPKHTISCLRAETLYFILCPI